MTDRESLLAECGIDLAEVESVAEVSRRELNEASIADLEPSDIVRMYQDSGAVNAVAEAIGKCSSFVRGVLWAQGFRTIPTGHPPRRARVVWEMARTGLRNPQIARRLGVTREAVCNQLRRARRHWGDPRGGGARGER